MRKITRQAAEAFRDGRKFNSGNTSVVVVNHGDDSPTVRMYLHGNEIAARGNHLVCPGFLVTLADWPTVTTRERLNGLLSVMGYFQRFYQKNYEQFCDGHPIRDDQWLKL